MLQKPSNFCSAPHLHGKSFWSNWYNGCNVDERFAVVSENLQVGLQFLLDGSELVIKSRCNINSHFFLNPTLSKRPNTNAPPHDEDIINIYHNSIDALEQTFDDPLENSRS